MTESRRPLKSRNTRWAAAMAGYLAKKGVRPNRISLASVLFGGTAAACLGLSGCGCHGINPWLFVLAAAFIQMRLVCNLLDGMVAIEGGFKTKSGEIYNELPDRFADAFILIGAGYAAVRTEWSPMVGWLSALLAVLTAYVRALGVSAGASQNFCGPMAKPHRMAAMTAACVLTALLVWCGIEVPVVAWTLVGIAGGCVITVVRRTGRILRELEQK